MKGLLAIVAASVVLAGSIAAQENRGELLGRVTDSSGAVIAGAKVTVTPVVSAAPVVAFTDSAGDYRFPPLEAGRFDLTVECSGFSVSRQRAVTVRAGGSVSIDVKLAVLGTHQSIQVTAHPPLVDVSNPNSGMVMDAETARQLPIRDGNPALLALLSPGVINLSEGGTLRAYDNENVSAMAVNGASSGTHEYTINGAGNTGGSSGNVAYVPPAGTVGEVRIDTSPFDVRQGFSSGAAVSMGLRQGSKAIHGQVYSYLENPVANANSFFSNAARHADNFRENRWGVSGTGPVTVPGILKTKNRTFWMYGYEGIRDSQPFGTTNLTYTMPTPPERAGNLADLLALGTAYQIYDPATTRPATTSGRYTRDPFAGNQIPPARLSQTAQNLISRYYPVPNLPGAKPAGVNYSTPSVQSNDFSSHVLRIDHAIGKHRLFVRANLNDRDQSLQRRFNDGAGTIGERNNRGLGVNDAYAPRPSAVLSFAYNYTRYVDNWGPPSAGMDLAALGFSSLYIGQIMAVDARNLMLPDIAAAGYPELNAQPAVRLSSDIHAGAAGLTRVWRRHSFQFGAEHRVYRDASGNTGRAAGRLLFDTSWTRGPLDNAAAAPIGQGLASFLLGLPTGGNMDINPSLAQQYQVSASYAQDTWRVHPRLTLNLGIRWEYEVPLTERYDRSVRVFDPAAPLSLASTAQANYAKTPILQLPAASFHVAGGLTFANVNGGGRNLWKSDPHNVAPRLALAWQISPKTVLRAGYGLAYDIARQSAIQTGFSRTTTLVASTNNGQSYAASLDNPFPGGFALPTGSSLGPMTAAGQSISAFPERLRNPYAQRWELTAQRSLGAQAVFQIAYVGNRGTHLRVTRQLDPVPAVFLSKSPVRDNAQYSWLSTYVNNPFYPLLPNTSLSSSTLQIAQLLRPYPQFTSITSAGNDGYSWYHSLQVSLLKRLSRDYMVTVAYTWSRYREALTYLNDCDPAPYRSISNQDRPQRLVTSFIYDVPLARRRRGWIGAIAKGWQIHGIQQQQSGAPLSFGNVLYYGGEVSLPASQRSAARWFNTAVFERGATAQLVYNLRTFPLRLGDARTQALSLIDLGVTKDARIGDKFHFEIRADAFNALNHTQFGAPNTSPTSTDFGKVTATSQLPRIIEFSLRAWF